MKWTKSYLDSLNNNQFNYSEDVDFSAETFSKSLNVQRIENVHVEASAKYDSFLERLMLDLNITGTMVIPCARTLEPVDYKFSINQEVEYSFVETDNEDAIVVSGLTIDTYEFVRECIILEIPLAVYKEGTEPIVPETDEDIDPRLAKLKELLK